MRLRVTTSTGCFFTVNVSQGGFCTEQMRVPKVGTRMAGHISLDGRDALFDGQVVWVLAGDSRLNQLGRAGLRFERVGPELAQGLAARSLPSVIPADGGLVRRRNPNVRERPSPLT
jgi:hypothetical protein